MYYCNIYDSNTIGLSVFPKPVKVKYIKKEAIKKTHNMLINKKMLHLRCSILNVLYLNSFIEHQYLQSLTHMYHQNQTDRFQYI